MTDDSAVRAWLEENAMPLQSAAAVEDAELEPLRGILQGVSVVGFAEATHGTREFFQIRQRMLRFLVTEMGFKALAIEASCSAAEAVNHYVQGGDGDCEEALANLGLLMWNVEEFRETLDWLRNYNLSVKDGSKVHLHGIDFWNTRPGRERVLAYLHAVARESVASIEPVFQAISSAEAQGMMRSHETISKDMLQALQDLKKFLETNAERFARKASLDEHRQVERQLGVIMQWVKAHLTQEHDMDMPSQVPRTATLNNYVRSRYMAENLLAILARSAEETKTVIWAHVFHLSVGFADASAGLVPNMGAYLRERFGDGYYIFGLETSDGAYLAREWLPDNTLGDFKIATLDAPPAGSLLWQLAKIQLPGLMLNFRNGPRSPGVEAWLRTPQPMHAVSWCRREPPRLYTQRAFPDAYDGILFFAHTLWTTPTRSAVKSVSARSGARNPARW